MVRLFGVIASSVLLVPSRSAVLIAVNYNPESSKHLHLKEGREVKWKLEYIHLVSNKHSKKDLWPLFHHRAIIQGGPSGSFFFLEMSEAS